ncbi:hypothetical protein HYU19_03520 [Candidatus Woesearchaeota archaeon]|nr:hypothetical protein [Candidatus Woesearchaeota archaeon]
MKSFTNVVQEIRKSIAQVLVIPLLLDGVVVFLALYLVVAFFSLSVWLALAPALAYTLFLLYRELRINTLKLVERYYPNLHEKLTTAADYASVDDAMVDELHKEVLQDVKGVATSSFVSRRKLIGKTFTCILLCFLLLSMTQFNDQTLLIKSKIRGGINDITARIIQETNPEAVIFQEQNGSGGGAGGGFNADIFGDKSLAKLGDEELDVEIKPAALELKIGTVKEAEKKDFVDVFPNEVVIESSQTYEENIPKEQQELVKTYFKKITEG